MAQEDYVVENGTGAVVRADLNAMLEAIVTLNSGPTAPTTTFANMWWYDETDEVLKKRNSLNTSWSVFDVEQALLLSGGEMTGNITMSGTETVDGRDLSVDGTKLDLVTVTASTDLDNIRIRVADLDASVVLRGGWDASSGTFPGGWYAQAGDSWIITVGGTVDGVAFSVNDRIVAIIDDASIDTYTDNWLKLDYTDLVASVNGQIGAVVLDPDDLDDTSTTNKFTTSGDISKLSGIESGADVTDATNVASSIHGVDTKDEPVDADELGLIDSAASNVLKRLTWTNLKATVKIYFDTLYTAVGTVLLKTGGEMSGDITMAGAQTVDGRDLSVDGAKLDLVTVTASTNLDTIRIRVNELDAAVVLMGGWDASVGTFPGGLYTRTGESWIVTTGGTVDGVDFVVNDRIVAIIDDAAVDTYVGNWLKLDYSDLVSSVNGQAGAVVLDPDDLDDTSTTNKFTTSGSISKLAGIESGADVTDAVNIASSIHGVAAKTTPADNDELGLIDSAASNVLKRLTWTNLKATLKTYFDTLYATVAALSQTVGINTQVGTTYTLALADAGKIVEMNNASANTLTIPTNAAVALPIKTTIQVVQFGAGATTINGPGVTIGSKGGLLTLNGQYAGATLYKRATDEWVVVGNMT